MVDSYNHSIINLTLACLHNLPKARKTDTSSPVNSFYRKTTTEVFGFPKEVSERERKSKVGHQ